MYKSLYSYYYRYFELYSVVQLGKGGGCFGSLALAKLKLGNNHTYIYI